MKLNLKKLKAHHQSWLFILDTVMMALILINLSWLIFDTLFASYTIRTFLIALQPQLFGWYYVNIHADFIAYDLIFVWIFISELLFRWAYSVYHKEYHRWWFYPFIHWYDLLGCIPVGSFRFLRLFRVFSILYRLQQYEIIDVRTLPVARFFNKYLRVIVEEVSDRVVVNILEGVQAEIRGGNPVIQRIVSEVLSPRDRIISEWMGNRLTDVINQSFYSRVPEIRDYVEQKIGVALQHSDTLQRYNNVPFLGQKVEHLLSNVVSEVVFSVVEQIADDLHGEQINGLLQESTKLMLDHFTLPDNEITLLVESILIDVINLVIAEVKIQKWKLEEVQV